MLRSSEFCKRYEYVRYDLQTPLVGPDNNQFQQNSGYKFYVDTTSEVSPLDIYNTFLEINFKITKKADNAGYADNLHVATINGSSGLIRQLECEYNGIVVIDTPNVNHAINVKNLVDFSKEYSDRVASSMFRYPDTNVKADERKYVAQVVNTGNGGNVNVFAKDNVDYNHGFAQRKTKLSAAVEVNVIYPLNRFGFVEAFEDMILPNGKLAFDFTLENDDNVIYQDPNLNDPAANILAENVGRYEVTKMVLWIPKMTLNAVGERLYLEKYLRNVSWPYLRERIEISPNLRVQQGTFRITPAIENPKHLFVWLLNSNVLNNQKGNMFVYNTYNIANNCAVTDCQLEVNSGNYYPQVRLNPMAEEGRAYRTLIEYNKTYNNHYRAPLIDPENFRKMFGVLYFDLSGKKDDIRNENVKLEFRFTLSKAPNADCNIYALILYEKTISIDITSGKAMLRT